MFICNEKKGLKFLEIEEMSSYGITAVFTTRQGGVSKGNYSSLNLGLHTKDEYKNVIQNREKIAAALQISAADFVAAKQVHGNNIYIVEKEDKGKGARDLKSSIDNVDALITATKKIPLISFYADCVPLIIYDPVQEVIALAHAGWKGTVRTIGPKTVIKMKQVFGSNPSDCLAGIGPSISQVNYEVNERIIEYFCDKFSFSKQIIKDKANGYYNLDLKKANLLSLKEIGLKESNIIVSDLCTYERDDMFYSYRRDNKKTGRMASIIMLQ